MFDTSIEGFLNNKELLSSKNFILTPTYEMCILLFVISCHLKHSRFLKHFNKFQISFVVSSEVHHVLTLCG